MFRLLLPALLLSAPALADEPKEPKPGESWVKVSYEIDERGDAMSCKVLATNINAEAGQNVCATILNRWQFGRVGKARSVTQYVVIKPKKS